MFFITKLTQFKIKCATLPELVGNKGLATAAGLTVSMPVTCSGLSSYQKKININIYVLIYHACINGGKCIRIVQTYQDPNHRSWLYHMRVRSELHFVLSRTQQWLCFWLLGLEMDCWADSSHQIMGIGYPKQNHIPCITLPFI